MPLDFSKMLASYAESMKKVWVHDRTKTVGASEAYRCMRAVWFEKFGEQNGYEKDENEPWGWGAGTRGNVIEDSFIHPAIEGNLPDGISLLYGGNAQNTLMEGFNSATPDGLLVGLPRDALADYGVPDIGESGCVVTEFKTIDPRIVLNEAREKNAAQAQIQMALFHETTEHKPEWAVVIYIDASFFDKIKVFPIKRDPRVWNIAKKRANMVFTATAPLELPAEGIIDGECKNCSWKGECRKLVVGSIPEKSKKFPILTEEQQTELEAVAREVVDLIFASKQIDKDLAQSKQKMKELLIGLKTRRAKIPGGSVSWHSMPGNNTVSLKDMEEDGIDLEPYRRQGAPYDVLKVKMAEDDDMSRE